MYMRDLKLGKIREVYKGKIFNIKERSVTYSDGCTDIFEFCERPPSVSILAFNEKGQLLMIREYRHGYQDNVWFLPGGRMDEDGDTPEIAAIRELREEAGYRPQTIKLIKKKSPSNTLLWDIFIFAAKDLVHDPLPHDKGEVIEPVFVPFEKAVQMAHDGTIDNEFISYNIIRFNYMLKHGEFEW